MSNDKIQWEADEYFHAEKSSDWFWTVGVVAGTLVAITLILGNFLFAVVLAVGTFTLLIYAKRKPLKVPVEINRNGIQFGTNFYSYADIDQFWIDRLDEQNPKILLKSKKMLMPLTAVPLGDADPDQAREFLFHYLHEQELEEPLSLKLMEYLGF